MVELTLEQGYRIATMAAAAVVAITLASLFYRRVFGTLGPRRWGTLLALRIVAILVVILLLFRPVVSYEKELERRPAVVFLLDRSASMSIADDATGVPRFEQARGRIESWCQRLQPAFAVHLLEFAEQAQPLENPAALAAVRPDGQATSISRALSAAAQQAPPQEIAAVVLVSDGNHNAARSPREVAGKLGVVVHTVGVGASLRSDSSCRDVQMTALDCPARLVLNNKAKLVASVEGVGLAGRVIRVALEEDQKPIAEQELTLDDVPGPQVVAFEFVPTKKGRHSYTVRAVALPEERIQENNARTGAAVVVEPGLRVLYLEGTLRAEYGALVDRFLAKDPDLEFCSLVQTRPNVFLKRSNITGLKLDGIPADAESYRQFDVIILGDLDSSYLPAERQKLLVERVRQGAGLVMLGGYHSLGPGGYAGTPLGEILPVELGSREIGQVTEPFLPELTPEGARHPIFANIAEFFPSRAGPARQEGLPRLDGGTRIGAARPAASVLATCSAANDMPVLAVQPVDRGRTAVFVGDTTRKWQQGPRARDQQSPYLRFWGQLVRYLAGRTGQVEAKAGIEVATDKGYYEPEEPVHLSATVRDERGEGTDQATVRATIRGPAELSETATLAAIPATRGRYTATMEPKKPGSYEMVVEATLGTIQLRSEKIQVDVGHPNLEFEKLDLDETLLSGIAADAGGRYVHLLAADSLIEELQRTQRRQRLALQQPLYWPRGYWALFVAVLSAEWILRRRFQLR